jgi:DNA-binding GntR family transcriptional regulator
MGAELKMRKISPAGASGVSHLDKLPPSVLSLPDRSLPSAAPHPAHALETTVKRSAAAPRKPGLDRPGPILRGERPLIVYEQLRDLIVHGHLAPGSRIVESDVAGRLGVSRTPVRGALQRLQQEGYIVDPSGGRLARPTVAPLTSEDAREVFHIVAEVEGLTARWAAGRGVGDRRALARTLRALNADFRRESEVRHPDYNRLHDLDRAFHRTYVEAGAGRRLLALHATIKPQAERYERLYVSLLVSDLRTSVAEHEAIAAAIERGNADAAQRAVQTNWRNAAERLERVIDRAGERGSW